MANRQIFQHEEDILLNDECKLLEDDANNKTKMFKLETLKNFIAEFVKDKIKSWEYDSLKTKGKNIIESANEIYDTTQKRMVSLEEIDLVTVEGFFVDALAVKELNRNFKESVYADGYIVVDIGALPNNSTKSVPANIPSAASEYWISNAWCKSRATGQVSPMPYIDASTWSNAIGITISASKNIVVTTKADWSAYSGKAVIAYKLSIN